MNAVGRLGWLGRWLWVWLTGHRRMISTWVVLATVASWTRGESLVGWVAVGLALPLALAGWAWWFPAGYERIMAGPSRRRRWRRYVRRNWTGLAEACGWARLLRDRAVIGSRQRSAQAVPRLRSVRAKGSTVTLVVRARAGQTLDQLEAGVPGLAATLDALSWRCTANRGSTSTLLIELVMHDALREPRDGTVPPGATSAEPGHLLPLGRRDVGGTWGLTVAGRHTLVAGCSGSGKGSVLWGLVAGLAPLVPSDTVRLWGIDLKHGVELRMGRALFAAVADTGPDALAVLAALLDVAERRGQAMAGQVRAHTPRPGDPLHVLVIDELADLVAYADRETRMEAARLLARLLTKGRALGVVVAAFVQDPRKDVVTMRNCSPSGSPSGCCRTRRLRWSSATARPGLLRHTGSPRPLRVRPGWSTTRATATGSAPTTGPTRSSASWPVATPAGARPCRPRPTRRARTPSTTAPRTGHG